MIQQVRGKRSRGLDFYLSILSYIQPNVKAQARRFLASPGAPCWAATLFAWYASNMPVTDLRQPLDCATVGADAAIH